MTTQPDHLLIAWWAKNLDELDREIARMAMLCQVRILDPGVIERVLHGDASDCGTVNPAVFSKLRNLLAMHFVIRERSVAQLGQTQTTAIERDVLDRLAKTFRDVGAELPSG